MDIEISDLSRDMAADPEIISLLEDDEIARDFYRALCNMRWRKRIVLTNEEQVIDKLKGIEAGVWSCTWRTAGAIIADIRHANYDTGENYMDFYCSGNESYISELVYENFDRLGWDPLPWPDEI